MAAETATSKLQPKAVSATTPIRARSGVVNDAFRSAQISGSRTQPALCPYQVYYPDQVITFAAEMHAPDDAKPYGGYLFAYLNPIRSLIDGYIVVLSQTQYWDRDPVITSNWTTHFSGPYTAAHYAANIEGPWSHDSGTVSTNTRFGNAEGYITMSGSSLAHPGFAIAQTGRLVNQSVVIRVVPDVDTGSYHYQWIVDGQQVSGNDNAVLSAAFGLPGDHSVASLASGLNFTDTIRTTVFVALAASILGPAEVQPYELNTWQPSVPGGYAPYAYSWSVDGSPGGSAMKISLSFQPATVHVLRLDVVDSHGYTAHAEYYVHAATGTCSAGDPNCMESLRGRDE